MAFGLTPEGFNSKRLDDVKSEIEADLRARLGQNINLLPQVVLGQIVGIISERLTEIFELAESVNNSQYPDTATDVQLDKVVSITGVTRRAATKSTISNQLLFGTVGALVPLGTLISVFNSPSSRFLTDADITLIAGTDEIQRLSLSATPVSGNFDINFRTKTVNALSSDTASSLQTKFDAQFGTGKFTVSGDVSTGGPVDLTFLGNDENGFGKRDVELVTITNITLKDVGAVDVTVTPSELTQGVSQGEVNLTADDTGPTQALSGTLSIIDTPVTGLDNAVNPLDANIGRNIETDSELKARREQELQKAGAATIEAILADLFAVTDVDTALVFQNNSDIVDLEGRPPHSVDKVIRGGDEDNIAKACFETVAAGIGTSGTITKIVTDSQGFAQTIKFSRPTDVDIFIEVDLTVDSNIFPINGSSIAEQNILAFGNSLLVGQDVIVFPDLICAISGDSATITDLTPLQGITDVVIRIGKSASPTLDDNIEIAAREIAVFDSSRITITEI